MDFFFSSRNQTRSGLTNLQLKDLYSNCIKLSTENVSISFINSIYYLISNHYCFGSFCFLFFLFPIIPFFLLTTYLLYFMLLTYLLFLNVFPLETNVSNLWFRKSTPRTRLVFILLTTCKT